MEGQNVSRSRVKGTLDMPEGAELNLGNWELEVDARLDPDTFMCGLPVLWKNATACLRLWTLHFWLQTFKQVACRQQIRDRSPVEPSFHNDFKNLAFAKLKLRLIPTEYVIFGYCRRGACFNKTADVAMAASAASRMTMPTFKKPQAATLARSKAGSASSAAAFQLHSPDAADSLVLNAQQWQQGQGKDSNGQLISPVVVDPYMSRQLRPHQREGVQFLYGCVSSVTSSNHCGAILADEMGLGEISALSHMFWTRRTENA